ncbi:unnamed protein product [Lampetra planeri]
MQGLDRQGDAAVNPSLRAIEPHSIARVGLIQIPSERVGRGNDDDIREPSDRSRGRVNVFRDRLALTRVHSAPWTRSAWAPRTPLQLRR